MKDKKKARKKAKRNAKSDFQKMIVKGMKERGFDIQKLVDNKTIVFEYFD